MDRYIRNWQQWWLLSKSESESHSIVSDSLWPHGLYSPWSSPGQNTGVGSLSLLQRIFPTQGSNSGLPHYRQIVYQLNHKGSPRILEWVAYLFSSRSSWPRNWTRVSCFAGRFFTNWAIREDLLLSKRMLLTFHCSTFCTIWIFVISVYFFENIFVIHMYFLKISKTCIFRNSAFLTISPTRPPPPSPIQDLLFLSRLGSITPKRYKKKNPSISVLTWLILIAELI